MNERLLVFDCHEAWVYQLRLLRRPMDIVVGLRGRSVQGWDERMRPVPPGARLMRMEEALRTRDTYACIVAHNLTDLLEVKNLAGPRLLVLHEALDGAAREQGLAVAPEEVRAAVARYVELTATEVLAVSELKGRSWGFAGETIPFAVRAEDYLPWTGELAQGLRVSNHVARRPHTLLWEFHQKAFGDLPVTLVGHNPGWEGVRAARDWEELKQIFRRHRFYIHTAEPRLEDGYNMATAEAMAAGLPVLGNRHPTSPVEHGVSGFLSDSAEELRGYALCLLADRELAGRMGAAAQAAAERLFGGAQFAQRFEAAIERAQRRWRGRSAAQANRGEVPSLN
jgi:glycosyltransferase involved in cell wall biosynthesis